MRALNYDEAVLILDKALKERGEDWVFPQYDECKTCQSNNWEDYEPCQWHRDACCRYFAPDGSPACLVGYVISETVDRSHLDMVEIEAQHALDAFSVLYNWGALAVEERTAEMLYRAQELQDKGISWGEAVAAATRQVPPL